MRHALHVLLDDGLEFEFHLLLLRDFPEEILFHQTIVEAEDGLGILTVELEHIAVFHILINAIQIIDSPSVLLGSIEHVDAKA